MSFTPSPSGSTMHIPPGYQCSLYPLSAQPLPVVPGSSPSILCQRLTIKLACRLDGPLCFFSPLSLESVSQHQAWVDKVLRVSFSVPCCLGDSHWWKPPPHAPPPPFSITREGCRTSYGVGISGGVSTVFHHACKSSIPRVSVSQHDKHN